MDREELIKEYTSYNTNLNPQDVVLAFPANVISYINKGNRFLCDYTVYQGESEQNYAWHFKIIKNSYKWGTIYTLQLHTSNGIFYIKTSTSGFTSGGESAQIISIQGFSGNAGKSVVRDFKSFVQESLVTLKRYNRHFNTEEQNALAYVVNSFMDELSPDQKGERETERDIENKMAEREAYLAAMRRSMRRGYDYWDD